MLSSLGVKHELGKRAVQTRHAAFHDGEAGARELGAGFKVKTHGFAQGHVIASLKPQRRRIASLRAPAPQLHIAVLVCALGHLLMRQVGHRQQQGLQFGLKRVKALGGLLEIGFDMGDFCHDRVCALALGFELSYLLGQGVATGLQILGV